MKLNELKDLYVHELRDLYNAEKRLLDAIPKMADRASMDSLKQALKSHLEETKRHCNRLEQIFEDLGEKPSGETCEAMQGIIEETQEVLDSDGGDSTIDAGLIAMGNRIEHYEMAGYGTARTHARNLGFEKHADLLQQSLDEEGKADEELSRLARECNELACAKS